MVVDRFSIHLAGISGALATVPKRWGHLQRAQKAAAPQGRWSCLAELQRSMLQSLASVAVSYHFVGFFDGSRSSPDTARANSNSQRESDGSHPCGWETRRKTTDRLSAIHVLRTILPAPLAAGSPLAARQSHRSDSG